MDILKDIFCYMKERKKYWLGPVIIMLFLLGVLVVVGGESTVAPFIYSLF